MVPYILITCLLDTVRGNQMLITLQSLCAPAFLSANCWKSSEIAYVTYQIRETEKKLSPTAGELILIRPKELECAQWHIFVT